MTKLCDISSEENINKSEILLNNDTLVRVQTKNNTSFQLWYGIIKNIPHIKEKILQHSSKDEGNTSVFLNVSQIELLRLIEIYTEELDPMDVFCNKFSWNVVQYKCGINPKIFKNYSTLPCSFFSSDNYISNVSAGFISMATYSHNERKLDSLIPRAWYDKVYSYLPSRNDKKETFVQMISQCLTFSNPYKFNIQRSSDLVIFSTYKCLLPPLPRGKKWKNSLYKDLINHIRLQANELILFEISGIQNMIMIENNNLNAKLCHNYTSLTDEQKLDVSSRELYVCLPLMLPWNISDMSSFPSVSVLHNEMSVFITLSDLETLVEGNLDSSLTILNHTIHHECVLMPQETRMKTAIFKTDGNIKPSNWFKDKISSSGEDEQPQSTTENNKNFKLPYCNLQKQVFHLTKNSSTTQVDIRFSHHILGLILNFSSPQLDMTGIVAYPFQYATIIFENQGFMTFHAADARDLMWRRCGKKTPKSMNSFLLPFSPYLFKFPKIKCSGVNFSKISNPSIKLVNNPEWDFIDWEMEVIAVTAEWLTIMGGMIGKENI